jgi:hypothetical protein
MATSFSAAKYPATVTSSSTNFKLTVGGQSLTCKSSTQSGTLTAASETLAMLPAYSECSAFGFVNAEVKGFTSSDCHWNYKGGGQVDLACATGDMSVTGSPCTLTLEASKNQGLSSVTYTNNTPSSGKVTAHMNVTNLHIVVTSHFLCPVAGGTYTNGAMTGSGVWSATNSGVPVSFSVGP